LVTLSLFFILFYLYCYYFSAFLIFYHHEINFQLK